MASEPTRLEKGGNKWADTPFGDQWHDKCITLWCVLYNDGAPEDTSHEGPGVRYDVWVYTTEEEAQVVADELNACHHAKYLKRYEVRVAAIVKHGDEDEAEIWLREQQLID